jgi:hypothetical protein
MFTYFQVPAHVCAERVEQTGQVRARVAMALRAAPKFGGLLPIGMR